MSNIYDKRGILKPNTKFENVTNEDNVSLDEFLTDYSPEMISEITNKVNGVIGKRIYIAPFTAVASITSNDDKFAGLLPLPVGKYSILVEVSEGIIADRVRINQYTQEQGQVIIAEGRIGEWVDFEPVADVSKNENWLYFTLSSYNGSGMSGEGTEKITFRLTPDYPTAFPTRDEFDTQTELVAKLDKIARRHNGKTYIAFGDSITEGHGTSGFSENDSSKYIPEQVGEIVGLETHNLGFSSTSLAEGTTGRSSGTPEAWSAFSFVGIVKSISSNDWSAQVSAAVTLGYTSEAKVAKLNDLYSVDYANAGIITVAFGTNDFGLNCPIGTSSDDDTETFYGALNVSIPLLRRACPKAQIIFITPLYRWQMQDGTSTDSDSYQGTYGKLADYCDAIVATCRKFHIEILDLQNEMGMNKENWSQWLSYDGLHPHDVGAEEIARRVAAYLLSH